MNAPPVRSSSKATPRRRWAACSPASPSWPGIPITPSSSLPETLIGYMRKYRMDKETGKATFAIVQAEDEIAALGMVVGASWAGRASMTSTSGRASR
jgi:pyruvate/2-oxoacid:ferredoxin oxidoreductase alpha subunit